MAYTPWELAMGQDSVNTGGSAGRVIQNVSAATARGGYNAAPNYQFKPGSNLPTSRPVVQPLGGTRQPSSDAFSGGVARRPNPLGSGWFQYLPGTWGFLNRDGGLSWTAKAPKEGGRQLKWNKVRSYLEQAGKLGQMPTVPDKPTTPAKPGYEWKLISNRWVQKLIGGIDPRDSAFFDTIKDLDRNLAMGASPLNSRLSQMQSQFTAEELDRLDRMEKSRYQSNADLIARGIYDSGERGNEALRLRMDDARSQVDLSQRLGQIAQSGVSRQLADLQSAYALDVASAIAQARNRHKTTYPASNYLSQYLAQLNQ